MQYQVTKQYERGGETPCGDFATLNEAHAFIRDQMIQDANMRTRIIYRIYESFDMIEEYDPRKGQIPGGESARSKQETPAASAGGQGKGASFRPTPLNTAPRPAGIPHSWIKDDEEGKDK